MLKAIRKYAFWPTALIIVAALFVVLKFITPLQLITTESMEPTIMPYSFVLDIPVSHVEKGQMITFIDDQGGNVTHRVIGFAKDGSILTKGDANQAADVHLTPLTMQHVVGAPLGGFAIQLWMLAAIVVILLLGYLAFSLLREPKGEKTLDQERELAHA